MKKTLAAAAIVAASFFPAANAAVEVAPDAASVRPLLIGATAPGATLANRAGEPVELAKVLSNKPTVVVFYRGGW